jgi:protein-tyrosine-phosphatase
MSRRYGIDLSGHLSSVIEPKDLDWADLIVLMDRHNWQDLRRLGATPERLVWLGTLDGGPVEIPDPYAMSDSSAEHVLQRLRRSTDRLASLLQAKSAGQTLIASVPQ